MARTPSLGQTLNVSLSTSLEFSCNSISRMSIVAGIRISLLSIEVGSTSTRSISSVVSLRLTVPIVISIPFIIITTRVSPGRRTVRITSITSTISVFTNGYCVFTWW